jgi:hypothetical protein
LSAPVAAFTILKDDSCNFVIKNLKKFAILAAAGKKIPALYTKEPIPLPCT